jgi:hypothetical protein
MFSEIEQESIQQGLPTPGEASARQRYLQKESMLLIWPP